ncbi:MAG: cytidine deaminase family protein [Armatimonadota bacterium]
MSIAPLDPSEIDELLKAAEAVYGEFSLGRDFSAGSCAAALRTRSGRVFTGICLDLACGIGFCAEHAAVAEMLKARETAIELVVAVAGAAIVPPCGRCRELMVQIDPGNLDTGVVLARDRVVPLRELLPEHWLGCQGG